LKPLVRWTISNSSDEGFECLRASIVEWRKIYGDEFDMVICHNNLSDHQYGKINKFGLSCVDQKNYTRSILYLPSETAWKLYPPRLRLNTHEIIIDNDVIIYGRLPDIDEFLESYDILICEAHRRFFGQFDSFIKADLKINTGIVGFPPSLDVRQEINSILKTYPNKGWLTHCCEQGVIGMLLRNNPFKLISLEDVSICNPLCDFAPYKVGKCGIHFASLNAGYTEYWKIYNS